MDPVITVHCPAEAAELFETVVNILNSNMLVCFKHIYIFLLCINLCFGPLHGKLSSNKSTLSQGSGVCAIGV